MKETDIQKKIQDEVKTLKPYVKELVEALKRWDSSPHIGTGHARQAAYDLLCFAIQQTIQKAWDNWSEKWSMKISSDRMGQMITDAMNGLELDTEDERKCWTGIIGTPEKNRKKVEDDRQ